MPGQRPSIDAAIDRAVRRMMDVDPPSGLRRRVHARLTAPIVAGSTRFTGYLAAAAALAVVVLAVGLMHRDNSPLRTRDATASLQSDVQGVRKPQAITAEPAAPPQDARLERVPDARRSDSRLRQSAKAWRVPHTEEIPMPAIVNLFGATGSIVSGASISAREEADRAPLAKTVAAKPIEIQLLSIAPLEIDPIRISEISAAQTR